MIVDVRTTAVRYTTAELDSLANPSMPFDNVTSTTGVALVNPLSYTSITVFLTFMDE